MKLLIIRHGDPDYPNKTLTPAGHREAALLAEYLNDKHIDDIYISPIARAQITADYTLKKTGLHGQTLPWLREFKSVCHGEEDPEFADAGPDLLSRYNCWDILPEYWSRREEFYHKEAWREFPVARYGNTPEVYRTVAEGLDRLLEQYGYLRSGNLYRAAPGSHKTAALFCHNRVECAMLSHLLNISPFVLWHCFVAMPSSITWLNTEERRQGVVAWRMASFGSLPHLARGGTEPSFVGRACSVFEEDISR